MRLVLSGGGTGGHVYPALAIAEQVKQEQPDSEFFYIGTNSGLEKEIVSKSALHIPFEAIEISGFKRSLSMDNVKTVIRFFRGVSRAKQLLREFRPDAVVGTGGYVCGPVLYAAAKLGIPTLVHEQNVVAGLTNKFLSRYANVMAVSFPGSETEFPKANRVVYTGNPRATTVASASKAEGYQTLGIPEGTRVVVVVGGSRGAKAINEAMVGMAPLLNQLSATRFVYITGKPYFEGTFSRIIEQLGKMPDNLQIVPYIHNMPEVLAATSLIVSRAGASFMAEILSLGIPSILIPSPNVTNNHQEANARSVQDAGAAEMVLERDLVPAQLFATIKEIISDPVHHKSMSKSARQLGMPGSAQLVYNELKQLQSK